MQYSNIKMEFENTVSTIRLNRPDSLNALSPELLTELSSALARVGEDESIKALVVRGEGRAFCSGADLAYLETACADRDRLYAYLQQFSDCFRQIEELPVPVIAVVHGYALAGGLELMLSCDMVLAAEDARIGDQHVNFGLIPGGGSTQRLPRRIGMQRAMELIFTGRRLKGEEAAKLGLVLSAVPAEELDRHLEKLLATLRTKSRPGLARIKALVRRGFEMPLKEGVAMEQDSFIDYVATSSHPLEGIRAFKEKRRPEF